MQKQTITPLEISGADMLKFRDWHHRSLRFQQLATVALTMVPVLVVVSTERWAFIAALVHIGATLTRDACRKAMESKMVTLVAEDRK